MKFSFLCFNSLPTLFRDRHAKLFVLCLASQNAVSSYVVSFTQKHVLQHKMKASLFLFPLLLLPI